MIATARAHFFHGIVPRRGLRSVVIAVMASALAFACSGGDDEAKKGGESDGAGGELIFDPPPNFGTGSTSGTGSTGSAPIDGCGYTGSRENCRGQQYAGEQIPLDIYVMFDQSCSMSCPAEQTGAGLC